MIEKGADIHAKDKFGWTALVYAVWNGHSKIAAMLLDYGITYEVWDLSGNAPLHYACAYGFKECVEVLLKAESELNALNDWKVAPISIAMMKNHTHIVTWLLEENSIDVNYMDDKGRTLLCLAMSSLTNENQEDYIKFLIEKRGADVNIGDHNKNTPLHHWAMTDYEFNDKLLWTDL